MDGDGFLAQTSCYLEAFLETPWHCVLCTCITKGNLSVPCLCSGNNDAIPTDR